MAVIVSAAQVGNCTFWQEFCLNYIDPAFSKIVLKFWNELRVGKKNYETKRQ